MNVARVALAPAVFALAVSAGLALWPSAAMPDGGCKPDGKQCATNISCCSRTCFKPAPPPGRSRAMFGMCCTPTTCTKQGATCGMIPDGDCGDMLTCGTCDTSACLTCGASHTCVSACASGEVCNMGVCESTTTTTATTTSTTTTTISMCDATECGSRGVCQGASCAALDCGCETATDGGAFCGKLGGGQCVDTGCTQDAQCPSGQRCDPLEGCCLVCPPSDCNDSAACGATTTSTTTSSTTTAPPTCANGGIPCGSPCGGACGGTCLHPGMTCSGSATCSTTNVCVSTTFVHPDCPAAFCAAGTACVVSNPSFCSSGEISGSCFATCPE